MPAGFELQNSPAEVERRRDVERPLVLLSTSGTRLMAESSLRHTTYAASLRNTSAVAAHVAARHERVLVVGAQSRREFREEDQLCCARIAAALAQDGYSPLDERTADLISYWDGASDDAFTGSRSVDYLLTTGQRHDLDFILGHVDDLDDVFEVVDGELVRAAAA